MLSVFGDESSDETKQRVFAVAGLIGCDDDWKKLESAWVERTKGVPFHANNCDSDLGVYARTPQRENKELYRDLAIMLAQSGLGGWALAIDLIAQRRIFPDAPDLSYYKGFVEVLEHMRNCAAFNRETVEFTFDSRAESEHNAGYLYGMFRAMPEWAEFMFPKISFARSKDYPRLQAADLFAREAMKALDNKIGPAKRPMRKSWRTLHETERFHIEAISDAWFEDLRRQMPAMEQHTGMSQDKYECWLKEYKLQHNTTNLFRFMKWTEKREKGGEDQS